MKAPSYPGGGCDRWAPPFTSTNLCFYFICLFSRGGALCGCQYDIRLNEDGGGFGKLGGHRREGWALVDVWGEKGGWL